MGRKIENDPTFTRHSSERDVVGTLGKMFLGKLECAQLKLFQS